MFTQIKTSHKITIGAIVAIALVGGVIFSFNFYQASLSKQKGAAVDLAQLESDYRADFKNIIGGYLITADSESNLIGNGFLKNTRDTQNQLLALKVPAALKDGHLFSALALAEIEKDINQGDLEKIPSQLGILRQLLSKF